MEVIYSAQWDLVTNPKVSVITPVYNRRLELPRALQSLEGQTNLDIEHIIINDGSTDRTAQIACLKAGGNVISIVADSLMEKAERDNVLFLSEEDFDQEFSAMRALSRNRVIHALGEKTFVAQCGYGSGGTWDGTVRNLRSGWSPVFCFRDQSPASVQLEQMGASLVGHKDLQNISALCCKNISFFDQ